MVVGLDIDGVLTNIERFQLEYGKVFFKEKYNKDVINPKGYDIEEIFDCTEEESKAFWTKYLLKYAIKEPSREGASELTKSLHRQGDKIKIITSRVYTDKDTRTGKLMRFIVEEWLKHNAIEYDDIIYCSEDKTDAIKSNNVDIMVEDNPKNITELSKLTNVICMNAGYNQNLKNVNRVNSMNQVLDKCVDIKEIDEAKVIENRSINEIKPIYGLGSIDKPWMKYYSYEERNFKLPEMTIYDYMHLNNLKNNNKVALNYFGKKITYNEMFKNIDKYARALKAQGIAEDDVITLCLPNIPEAIYMFYALNKIGAVANMIHPLKRGNELKESINEVNSKLLVMIDNSYDEINQVIDQTNVNKAIIVSAGDSMPLPMKLVYKYSNKETVDYSNDKYIKLSSFIDKRNEYMDKVESSSYKKDKTAVIMHTGGTSGFPKGVEITNDNFNGMVHQQKATAKNFGPGDTMLTIMPVFHGFGLCSSVHMPLSYGITTILVPKFNSRNFHELIEKYKPNHIFGVPKLWKALMDNKKIQQMDLSFMRYVVSGGENMKDGLEEEINQFLKDHGCYSKIKKGYGLSEAVAGTTLSDDYSNEIGSVGIPLICNNFKVVKPGTQDELEYNQEGEFCVTGPTIMKGYINNPEETAVTLQKHEDGKVWLHTGDMGYMTEDGMLYYTDRLTRMYVSAGFNIYPPHIETIIEQSDKVDSCAVVPINHPYKDIKVPKAYIILKKGCEMNNELTTELKEKCKENLDIHHQPYRFEEIKEFPMTNMGTDIGKIDYKALEMQANELVKVKKRK